MKIDRLIGITMYLLNRDVVSSRELAERFEVSSRTIVRDMEALSAAGIPVASSTGASGGYEILGTYALKKPLATAEDFQLIVTALKGMCSAYGDQRANMALEKLMAAGYYKEDQQRIFIDFGVVGEGDEISERVRAIERAIRENVAIRFDYTDGAGRAGGRTAEPVALQYRWYAWYLLAYCPEKGDFRLFKLNRMARLAVTDAPIGRKFEDIPALLEGQWKKDDRRYYDIRVLCKADVRVPVLEYLKGGIVEERESGDFILETRLPEGERAWFSILLGFGSAVKVLKPPEVIRLLKEKSAEIYFQYRE